jgi:flagella basal body P-ring formation protein FlgA
MRGCIAGATNTGPFAATAIVTFLGGSDVIARVPVRVDLTLSAEAATPDLAHGTAVTLVVRQGLIEVRIGASAGADANIGDTLPVVLRPSGRVLQARLIEPTVALAVEGP